MAQAATHIMVDKIGNACEKDKTDRSSAAGSLAEIRSSKKRSDSHPPVQEGEKQRRVIIEKGIAGDSVHENASDAEILKVIRGLVRAVWVNSDVIYYTEEGLQKMMDKYKHRELQYYYRLCYEENKKPVDYGDSQDRGGRYATHEDWLQDCVTR